MTAPTPPAVSEAMCEAVARALQPVLWARADAGLPVNPSDAAWGLAAADRIIAGPIASEIARLTGERDAAQMEAVNLRDMLQATVGMLERRIMDILARAEAAEAETARLRAALSSQEKTEESA